MNLPNLITVSRLVITAGVFVCLEVVVHGFQSARQSLEEGARPWGQNGHWHDTYVIADPTMVWVAFTLFLIAAFTDFVDGWLARRWNMVTAFGRVADPFADKVLISGTLVLLLQFPAATSVLTGWYVVIVIAREFLVTAVRGVVEASGRAFPADQLGKWKMVSQCWTVGALLSMVAGTGIFYECAILGFWVSLVLTVVSGLNYLWKARDVLFAQRA